MPMAIDLALLGRYLDGAASAEERAAVDVWIGPDPARRALVAELQAAWVADAKRLANDPSDAAAVWARLTSSLGLDGAEEATAQLTLRHPRQSSRVLRLVSVQRPAWSMAKVAGWAAVIVGAAAAGGASWYALRERPTEPVAVAAMREYTTPRGQRATFRLADGTEVMLNAESRLRVPAAFGMTGRAREVQVSGQAYFTVVHDATRPFTVRTGRGVIRDIGTRFDVRAYSDDAGERVAVAEGEVAVRGAASAAAAVSLRAGQMAALASTGHVTVAPTADVASELAWTRGRLEFENVSLAEAARRFGRWYDLDVRITGAELAQRRVTGSYGDEPLTQVLTVLTAAVGARYEWRGRTVTISAAGGAP